jgi:hypothetical protein
MSQLTKYMTIEFKDVDTKQTLNDHWYICKYRNFMLYSQNRHK